MTPSNAPQRRPVTTAFLRFSHAMGTSRTSCSARRSTPCQLSTATGSAAAQVDRNTGHGDARSGVVGSLIRPMSKSPGVWRYVDRAVDQHGQVIDVLVSARRDIRAARRFFTAMIAAHGVPEESSLTGRQRWPT